MKTALSDTLMQAAFGRALPEMSYCLGIYLGAEAAYVAEVRADAPKPRIEHLVKVPLPLPEKAAQRATGVLQTDALADTERLAGLLQRAMAGAGKWRSEYAVVTVSHAFGILRYFVMPAIDQRFWKMAVPAEAKKYIPVQFENLLTDFQIEPLPPGPDKRARQGSLFGVTQAKNIEHIRALLAKLGVKLAAVELSPISVSRAWEAAQPASGAPYAQVHFDGGDVHILLSERGLPIFVREVILGPQAKVADRRKLDLAGCLDFSKKQLGVARPSAIRVSGETAEREAWVQALAQESQLKVEVQDTPKLLGLKGAEWGGYAAIGAGMRPLVRHRLAVDLSGAGRVDDNDRRVALSIFSAAGVLSALFLCLGLWRHGCAVVRATQLARLRSRGLAIAAFQGKSSADIETMVNAMRQKSSSIAAVTSAGVKVTHLLEDLAEDVPEEAWLTQVNYSYPIDAAVGAAAQTLGAAASGNGRSLLLQGSVVAPTQAAEQDLAIKFKEQLQTDPRFQKVFPSIEISVTASGAQASGGGAGAPATRTGFSIACAGRAGG